MLPFLCFRKSHVSRLGNRDIDGEKAKRGLRTIQIGPNKWDFDELFKSHGVMTKQFEGINYYFSFGNPLKQSDVPDYGSYSLEVDTYAMGCDPDKKECWEIAFGTDFDYKHEDPQNHAKGLIYFADGLPHDKDGEKVNYDLYDIVHNIHCDNTSEGKEPSTFVIRSGSHVQFYFDWDTKYGCPTTMEKPPDVPEVPEPDCHFESIIGNSTLSRLGISLDMSLLNNGPVGIRQLFGYGDEVRLMYYTPCGYSDCPYSAKTCTDGITASPTDDRGVSSIWICDIKGEDDNQYINECVSYGDEKEQPDVVVDPNGEFEGITHTLSKGDKRRAIINYDCEQAYPGTYVEVGPFAGAFSKENFIIDVDNTDVCTRIIPKPEPSGSLCKINKYMTNYKGNKYTVNVDLQTLNSDPEKGYQQKVKLHTIPPQEKMLRFQPCGALLCPTDSQGVGYHCDGDEDAVVWLCDDVNGGEKSCDQYGKFKNVSLYTVDAIDRSILNGLVITYTGGLHKTAKFNLKCDDSAISGKLSMDQSVDIKGNTIEFTGFAKDVCANGEGPTPTPFPVVQPVIPQPTTMPTPNPRPNHDLFIANDTHFIYIDLMAVDKKVYRGDQQLFVNGKYGPVYSEYSPWQKIPCPSGYTCKTGDMSNVWSCWQLQDIAKTMYCHNSGDINFGVWMDKLGSGTTLDDGVMLSYEGQYSSGADFRLKCKFGWNTSSLTNLNSFVTFTQGGPAGDTFEYSTTTELACPSEFNPVDIPPTPTATPTPPPHYNPPLHWESPVINGKQIRFDLEKLSKTMTDKIYIGTGNDFEKTSIYYSPSQRVSCPANYDCLPNNQALGNVFKCFINGANPECFVIGDKSYELNFALNNASNLDDGIRVEYGGGYGGKYEAFMQFWCNRSVKAPNYQLHQVANAYASKKVLIEIETDMACPIDPTLTKATTFGAVFLLFIFTIAAAYVVFGVTITFFAKGVVALPNAEFWSNFFDNVATGAVFISSCGKTTSFGNSSYETI